jgi:hypothetical protein
MDKASGFHRLRNPKLEGGLAPRHNSGLPLELVSA